MSEPFIAEVRMFAGNFAPRSWAFCDGQLMPIAQNTALFSLIGTIYGGDSRTNFGLPDLRGRTPMHPGSGPGLTSRRLGEQVSATPIQAGTADAVMSVDSVDRGLGYSTTTESLNLSAADQAAVSNGYPALTVHFIIALQGLFPSRS